MDKFAFGKLLTKLRQRDGMTQSDLADALNVSVSAVSKWETGKNFPDIPVFAELKKLFDLSYDDLYRPTETLSALENGTLLSAETRAASSDAAVAAIRKKSRQTLLVLLLLLALLAALSLFLLAQKALSRPADTEVSSAYWIYAAGTAYDEKSFQNVYEIHLVAENPEKITEELWQEEFYRYAKNWWAENPDTEIRYLWIYTYDTVEDARRKETPVHSGYTYYKSETDK